MASLVKRRISGNDYFYLEKNIKLGPKKWKKVSVNIGRKQPDDKKLKEKNKELNIKVERTLDELYGKNLDKYTFSFLSRKQLIEIEKTKTNFLNRYKKLGKEQKEKFKKQQTIDFVYTTLRTEGVNVESSDVETALKLLRKKRGESIMNEKVIISSLMISGYELLSNLQICKPDFLKLHGIIMSYFEGKSPGQIRDDQRVIMRFNPKTFVQEEINYRPPAPAQVEMEFEKFFDWFKQNKHVYPLELAALVHLKLYLIHPFKDGNKRMCRLLFNKILQDADYPMLNISKETSAYFSALIRSVEERTEKYFVEFCYKTFIEQVKNKRFFD